MNKLVYICGAVIVIITLGVLFVGLSGPASPAANSTVQTTQAPVTSTQGATNYTMNTTTISSPTTVVGNSSTAPTFGNHTTIIYNSTPTGKSCANLPGYDCYSVKCNIVNSSFTCANASYGYEASKNISELSLSVGQNTGTGWSGFGVAWVPTGTAMSGGVPQATFYVADNSTSNVGTSLQSGQSTFVQLGESALGAKGAAELGSGTIWVCYINSGTLYVGSGCLTSNHQPAQYAEVASINVSS